MTTMQGDLSGKYSQTHSEQPAAGRRLPPRSAGRGKGREGNKGAGGAAASSVSQRRKGKGSDEVRPSPESHTQQLESGDQAGGWQGDLLDAICADNWNDARAILDQNPNALTAEITGVGKSALHVAAQFGSVSIVAQLLNLLDRKFLRTRDSGGDTALTLACCFCGNIQVAKCLVNKNSDLVGLPNKFQAPPVALAFRNGYEDMGRYLYSVTPPERLTGRKGSWVLVACIEAQCFDIALDLLHQSQELLLEPANYKGRIPIHDIAILNTVIPSPTELTFWKQLIYNYINIPSTTVINYVRVDMQQDDRSQRFTKNLTGPGHGLLQRLINFTIKFEGVKKIQKIKLLNAQADELLRFVSNNARKAHQKGILDKALCLAAKEGNAKFVFQVSKVIPEVFLTQRINSCFHKAIVHRQARVFNLILELRFKQSLKGYRDAAGTYTTLMHMAAEKAPDYVLNRIYAPTLQMQQELQWFKKVESLSPPGIRGYQNKAGMTAEEVFKESHKELMKEGEKWIKDTASSCSVVGTLIVTIMFAAAFTVPGGNDQNLGYPLFIKQPFFKVFIFSTILSFISSSTSVLMFLAILTTQYSQEKFIKSLPTKLILGLSFLFFSVVGMIIAFLSTIRLMVNHTNYLWSLLPIIILATVPIFLFALSQFPLLLHTCVSTYGDIFDQKVEPWP